MGETEIQTNEETPQIIGGHHAMAAAAFTWDEVDEVDEETPQIIGGHHAMAAAAFTWDE